MNNSVPGLGINPGILNKQYPILAGFLPNSAKIVTKSLRSCPPWRYDTLPPSHRYFKPKCFNPITLNG